MLKLDTKGHKEIYHYEKSVFYFNLLLLVTGMNKKLIVALIVSALLSAGFLYVRDKRTDEKDSGRKIQAFNKLTEIGKKMPKAGLIKMGTVLKNYRSDHDEYPPRLMDLYPDYIPVREFIEELSWYYEPRGEDFFLSKTVERGSQKYAASINRELIPRDGETVLIASVGVKKGSGEDDGSGIGTFDLSILKTAQLAIPEVVEEEKRKEHIIKRPEIVSVTEGEIGRDISSETGAKFFVWRDENGALGFGNVTYPESDRQSVYDDSSWIEIRKPSPRERKGAASEFDFKGPGKDSEDMALAYSNDYLVWRDKDGRLGVGNMQYPEAESPLIYMDGKWTGLKPEGGRAKTPSTASDSETGVDSKEKTYEGRLPAYGDRYLVWKSKDGKLGIGNVQYPGDEDMTVYSDGDWVQSKYGKEAGKAPIPGKGVDMEGKGTKEEKKKDKEETVSKLGDQYLVWKYKDGRIGMGNVQYPSSTDTAIYLDGKWVRARYGKDGAGDSSPGQWETVGGNRGEEAKKKGAEETISRIGDQYLVWKYKDGRIGMGNVQYPGADEIEHVWVNGSWQKVAKGKRSDIK